MTEAARFTSSHRVDRHRFEKRERPSPYDQHSTSTTFPGGNRAPPYNRVFISNIPYDEKWQGLKDLFREKVGEVTYVELITDDSGNSRGFGVVEFKSRALAEEAVEKMRGYALGDRKLVVKEDFEGRILRKALSRVQMRGEPSTPKSRNDRGRPRQMHEGLPPSTLRAAVVPDLSLTPAPALDQNSVLLEQVAAGRAIGNAVFVANLDYKVNYSKLKDIFKLAGNVVKIELHLDENSKSRGMATVVYETVAEAVRAVSMFNKQPLYERPMVVKMDRGNETSLKQELPSGLQGIGGSLRLDAMQPSQQPYFAREQLPPPPTYVDDKEYLRSHADSGGAIPGLSKLSSHLSQMNRERSGYGSIAQSHLTLGMDMATESDLRGGVLHGRDRQQIDLDIARVDSRIRDLDKSLALGGRRLDEQPIISSRQTTNSTVFVHNLPFNLSWQALKEEFSRVGDVQFVELKMVNGRSMGYGWVRFATHREAEMAIHHLGGTFINGRKIGVQMGEHGNT